MIELSELQDAAQKAFPSDQLRPERDKSWQLITEMGWLMVRVPEEDGGLGLDRGASTAILCELGKVLQTAPVIPGLLSIDAIVASNLTDRDDWIERTTSGEYIAPSLGGLCPDVSSNVLNGTINAVPDADLASNILVLSPGLAALAPIDATGVTITEKRLWDESRRLFDVSFDKTPVDDALILATGDAADALLQSFQADLALALAADSLGGANATLQMTVEYLQTRNQFGRPLAMFQALKHRCADLKTQISAAEALLWERVATSVSPVEMGALKALASDVYRFTCEEAIQLHGGIGLTEEHHCHLFMKRAFLNLQLGGSTDDLRESAGRAALAELA